MPRTAGDRQYQYFPAFLDLVGKRVLVVGGGAIAAAKIEALLPCGVGALVVVAPEICPSIARHAAAQHLQWVARPYRAGDLADADLAFAATDDRELNAVAAAEARARRIPVLAVDDVANCDFIAPAVTRRGALVVAVSTHGRSPAVARRVREWLDATLPSHWGELLDVVADVRTRLGSERRSVPAEAWQTGLDGAVENLVCRGEVAAAGALLLERLQTHR